jgi:hypothetical protein
MKRHVILALLLPAFLGAQAPPPAGSSTGEPRSGSVPIYNVNVVARTTKAVNYQHRSGPTQIGFSGTVLLPDSEGKAAVESKKGAVQIQAEFKKLKAPTKFGRQYLTYVLWAITPEGRPHNLGELIANSGDKAKLETTTALQAFGLIVTAEPYYAVTEPSDVVVMENVVLPETLGRVQTVDANFELLKRGTYNYDKTQADAIQPAGEKLRSGRYEALLEVYQARNAVQIAKSQGAEQYAASSYLEAAQMLELAEAKYAAKGKNKEIVAMARQATQTAEDARLITERKKEREQQEQVARQ